MVPIPVALALVGAGTPVVGPAAGLALVALGGLLSRTLGPSRIEGHSHSLAQGVHLVWGQPGDLPEVQGHSWGPGQGRMVGPRTLESLAIEGRVRDGKFGGKSGIALQGKVEQRPCVRIASSRQHLFGFLKMSWKGPRTLRPPSVYSTLFSFKVLETLFPLHMLELPSALYYSVRIPNIKIRRFEG